MEFLSADSLRRTVLEWKSWVGAHVFPMRDLFVEELARAVPRSPLLDAKILECACYWLLHTDEQLRIDQTTARMIDEYILLYILLYIQKSVCTELKHLVAQYETNPEFDPITLLKSAPKVVMTNFLIQPLHKFLIELRNEEKVGFATHSCSLVHVFSFLSLQVHTTKQQEEEETHGSTKNVFSTAADTCD